LGVTGVDFATTCNQLNVEQKVSPSEDLIQGHGLLNRALLIFMIRVKCNSQIADIKLSTLLPTAVK
jgi:hypothetical protein